MNRGIYGLNSQFATTPRELLGRPAPIYVIDNAGHPEAIDWANRVRRNGGEVSAQTLAAVNQFCADIDAARIRDKIFRLNLFVGSNLSACLVPLFLGPSLAGIRYGNATDINVNFVAADYSEAGPSSGLSGNGSTKYLNTGYPVNTTLSSNAHLAIGLTRTETQTGYRAAIGASSTQDSDELSISTRRGDSTSYCAIFGRYFTASEQAGEVVQSVPLGVGNLIASYPSFYRNGVRTGVNATAARAGTRTTALTVFAFNGGTVVNGHSNCRLNWYSFGAAITADQVLNFQLAISAFNTTLVRT